VVEGADGSSGGVGAAAGSESVVSWKSSFTWQSLTGRALVSARPWLQMIDQAAAR